MRVHKQREEERIKNRGDRERRWKKKEGIRSTLCESGLISAQETYSKDVRLPQVIHEVVPCDKDDIKISIDTALL